MVDEVEIKFLNINSVEIEKKLKTLGAKKKYSSELVDVFLNNKLLDIDFKNPASKSLRVRSFNGAYIITFKGKVEPSVFKIQDEVNASINSFEESIEIFEKLGFSKKVFRKTRTHYELDKVHFEIDKWVGLPAFLEIETSSIKEMERVCKLLDFDITKGDKRIAPEIWPKYFV